MYLVTTIKMIDDAIDDVRTVGYYNDLKEAQYCIIENIDDIFEDGFYQYGIITKFEEGTYPSVEYREWYIHDNENDITYAISKPDNIEENKIYIIG